MLELYKAFVLPHFQYCSAMWHFCRVIEQSAYCAWVLNDRESTCHQFLDRVATTPLYNLRIQNNNLLCHALLIL